MGKSIWWYDSSVVILIIMNIFCHRTKSATRETTRKREKKVTGIQRKGMPGYTVLLHISEHFEREKNWLLSSTSNWQHSRSVIYQNFASLVSFQEQQTISNKYDKVHLLSSMLMVLSLEHWMHYIYLCTNLEIFPRGSGFNPPHAINLGVQSN